VVFVAISAVLTASAAVALTISASNASEITCSAAVARITSFCKASLLLLLVISALI